MPGKKHALTLLPGQDLPSRHDHVIEDLEAQDCSQSVSQNCGCGTGMQPRGGALTFGLLIRRAGQDVVDHQPGIGILFELRVG